MQVSTIGLDLAKRVFQVHGVDAEGRVVMQRKLQRGEVAAFFADLRPCRVGIEACATAHYWARLIGASGHQVRLIPPSYVKPYVRRSKTDAADAAAICESVGRPSMRFVPVKSAVRQAALLHHRVRDLSDAAIAGQDGRAFGMGQDVVGSPSVPVGLAGAGEQDGADRL